MYLNGVNIVKTIDPIKLLARMIEYKKKGEKRKIKLLGFIVVDNWSS